jgi:hypothetical protein
MKKMVKSLMLICAIGILLTGFGSTKNKSVKVPKNNNGKFHHIIKH